MVSTRMKWQSNRNLLSQLDDFDRDSIIGNAMRGRKETVVVNEGTVDQVLTVNKSGSNLAANGILVNVKTLERCFFEWIDREMRTFIVHCQR